MDDVTWVVDGQTVGRNDAFVKLIKHWKTRKGVVIQIAPPLDWTPNVEILGSIHLESLNDGERMRVFRIRPFPTASRPK
jgi:hypothetical protein